MLEMNISKKQIDNYKKDGAIKIPSLFTEWINEIKDRKYNQERLGIV